MANHLSVTADTAEKSSIKHASFWFRNHKKLVLSIAILITVLISIITSYGIYDRYFSPKARLLKDLNLIIEKINNPDPKIVAQYNYSADHVLSNQQQVLNGAPTRQIPGLLTVQETLKRGDKILAKQQLEKVYKTFLLHKVLLPGSPDRVFLTDEEKKQIDPDNIYVKPDTATTFAALNKEVGMLIIQLLYKLK